MIKQANIIAQESHKPEWPKCFIKAPVVNNPQMVPIKATLVKALLTINL